MTNHYRIVCTAALQGETENPSLTRLNILPNLRMFYVLIVNKTAVRGGSVKPPYYHDAF